MNKCCCVLFGLVILAAPACVKPASQPHMANLGNVVIVRGADRGSTASWRNAYAARELGKYLSRMSAKKIEVIGEPTSSSKKYVIVIGNEKENSLTRRLVGEGLIALNIPNGNGDGFVLRSAKKGNKQYLVMAGENSISTLYAVYDYLERFCNVGFFMDGEYVPKAGSIPCLGVDFSSKPRFEWRSFRSTNCQVFGLRKYGFLFRRREDWEKYLSWMVKRKTNLSGIAMGCLWKMSGTAPLKAFGIEKEPTEEYYVKGYPFGWAYPHQYMTNLTRYILKYGRDRGIKFDYELGFGDVPYYYKRLHPEYNWVKNLDGDQVRLHPDDPVAYKLTKNYLQTLVDLFGTDHIYFDSPFGESQGAPTVDESLRIKTEAARQDLRMMKEVDPKAIFLNDTWDMNVFSDTIWVPKNVNKYLSNFNTRDIFIFDAVSDLRDKFYKRNGYFFGKNWGFGILHSYEGDDHLHGDIAGTIAKVKTAINDPNSTRLKGYFQIPEMVGHNILYWQLTTQLAWDANGVNQDSFLKRYALTRYGKQSASVMEKSLRKLVEAVYSKDYPELQMIYKKIGDTKGFYPRSTPIVDGNSKYLPFYFDTLPGIMNALRQAIDLALTQKAAQKGNALYENDMIAMVKNYLGFCFNYHVCRAYKAFKAGKSDIFERECAESLAALKGIRNILSTRRDYYLQVQIDEVESHPGNNPYSAKMIRRGSVNDLYPPNDVYELMCCFYIPRFEIWRDAAREKLRKGDFTLTSSDLQDRLSAQFNGFVDNPFDPTLLIKYPTGALQAVRDSYAIARKVDTSR